MPRRTARSAAATRRLLVSYHRTRDPAAREALVHQFLPLARRLAGRYRGDRHSFDDLSQVAAIGLLKAIDRFDPSRGTAFTTFATPTITGELKRHFRDTGWAVRVPRGLKDLALEVSRATDALERQLGRPSTPAEIAEWMGTPPDDVHTGRQVLQARFGLPLERVHEDDDDDDRGHAAWIGIAEDGFHRVEQAAALDTLMAVLGERDREVLRLRFSDDLKQSDIAARMGVSQMQISRVLRRALETLGEASSAGALR